MEYKTLKLYPKDYPPVLANFQSPPPFLYYRGNNLKKLLKMPRLAIVGTRKMSNYGEMVTRKLATQLAEQGVVIVSGLAYGVDAMAHLSTVEAGGLAIAVLPSPVDNVVPVYNRRLAAKILEQGGALVSEYPPGLPPGKQNFIARNRLVSALSNGVLVTEAPLKSGAIYTAENALSQNLEVMAVPGNINLHTSIGTNNLLKKNAHLITDYKDVLNVMGLVNHETHVKQVKGRNQNEQLILDLLLQGITDAEELLERSGLEVSKFNQSLTMLELNDKVLALGANHWAIK